MMGTDPCGYVQCGNQEWANVGVLTAMIGGVVLVVVDLVVSIVRMAKGKPAWFVPVIFCVVQVGLGVAGFALVSLAGPV